MCFLWVLRFSRLGTLSRGICIRASFLIMATIKLTWTRICYSNNPTLTMAFTKIFSHRRKIICRINSQCSFKWKITLTLIMQSRINKEINFNQFFKWLRNTINLCNSSRQLQLQQLNNFSNMNKIKSHKIKSNKIQC